MICCGPEIPKFYDKQEFLKRLRNINDLECAMKLNQFSCEFDQDKGEWRNNFNSVKPLMSIKYDEEIKELRQNLFEKEVKCDELEKLYLAKAVKLFYMAQAHCQIKGENEKLFEKYGIKGGNKLIDLNKLNNAVRNDGFPQAPNPELKESKAMNNVNDKVLEPV